jgi:hypothetical protein
LQQLSFSVASEIATEIFSVKCGLQLKKKSVASEVATEIE